MRVLVCGSRSRGGWSDVVLLKRRLAQLPPGSVVIHGAARGADTAADQVARELEITVERFPADWAKHGRRAGIIRNGEMLDTKPALVIALWDARSPGTLHTMTEARRRGIPVERLDDILPGREEEGK